MLKIRTTFEPKYLTVTAIFALVVFCAVLLGHTQLTSAAACPATNLGSVTSTINIPSSGTYRIWSRIMTGTAATDNSYSLEVDSNNCYVVGDNNNIPTNTWTWIDYQNATTSSKIDLSLTAGNHTFKMIGRESAVQIDKVIAASDTTCIPTGTGGNCAEVASSCTGTDITTATFVSRVSAAAVGDVLCLTSGNYSTWTGTNKAITIKAAEGATPQMKINFGSGDTGFTLDGMTGMGGDINGATNITIRNATFTSQFRVVNASKGIVVEDSTWNYPALSTGAPQESPYKVVIDNLDGNTLASPALTFQRNSIQNGDYDGIHIGGDGVSGVIIKDSVFKNLCAAGPNHTDNIQFGDIDPGAREILIKGNWVYAPVGCGTQAIASYDAGTDHVIIEDNVVDIATRAAGIEIYGDGHAKMGGVSTGADIPGEGSIVRHNTVVYRPPPCLGCVAGAGEIDMNSKLDDYGGNDPQGVNTQAYDNITTQVQFATGRASGTQHHNGCHVASGCTGTGTLLNFRPTYVGNMSAPTKWSDYCLAENSPGKNAASDGLDIGIRCQGVGAAPTLSLTANPTSVNSGSASTLTWNSTNATSCTASGDWSGSKATSGSQSTGNLTVAKSYTLTCTNTGGSANQSRSVTVNTPTPNPPTPPPPPGTPSPTLTLKASSVAIDRGDSVKLTWTTTNASSCSASSSPSTSSWSGTKSTGSSKSQTIANLTSTKTYTLTCSNSTTNTKKSVKVTVRQPVTGDLNNDRKINIFDLSILLSKYGTTSNTADINNDKTVNIFDLSILLSRYGG